MLNVPESTGKENRDPRFLPAVPAGIPDQRQAVSLLQERIKDSRLTMMVGPHGCGKTTLAAQWAHCSEETVVWVSAESAGGDPWKLCAHLVAELRLAADVEGLDVLVAGLGARRPLRRMGLALARHLRRRGTKAVIVVDQAELLGAEAGALITALAERSPNLRFLVLAVYLEPDFVVDAESRCGGQRLDAASLGLHRWESAHRTVGRLVSDRVLGGCLQPLMALGILGEIDAELIAELCGTGEDSSWAALHELERHALGHRSAAGMLQAEEHLRASLRRVAEDRLSPADRRQAQQVISERLQRRGQVFAALSQAEGAGDWDQVGRIVLRNITDHAQDRGGRVRSLLQRIPKEVLRRKPYLGWYQLVFRARAAEPRPQLRRMGEDVLSAIPVEADGVAGVANDAVRFAVHRTLGEFETADDIVIGLLPRAEGICAMSESLVAELSVEQQVVVGALRQWAAGSLRQYAATGKLLLGEHAQALSLIEPLVTAPVSAEGQFSERSLYSAGLKAVILTRSGDHRGAELVLDWLRGFPLPLHWELSWAGSAACLAAAYLAVVRRDPEQARRQLTRIRRHEAHRDLWPLVLDHRVRISLYEGHHDEGLDLDEFLAVLQSRQALTPTSRYWQLHLHLRAMALALAEGSLGRAEEHLQRAVRLDYPGRPGLSLERAKAFYLLHADRPAEAGDLVRQLLAAGNAGRDECALRYLLGISEYRLGHHQVAEAELRAAFFAADEASLNRCLRNFHSPVVLAEMLDSRAPEQEVLLAAVRQQLGVG